MNVSEPTRATRNYLAVNAATEKRLRASLKALSARKRREAIERAATARQK